MNPGYLDELEDGKWENVAGLSSPNRDVLYLAMATTYRPKNRRCRAMSESQWQAAKERLRSGAYVAEIATRFNLTIHSVLRDFDRNRQSCINSALAILARPDRSPLVVFADPDTGVVDGQWGFGENSDPRYLSIGELHKLWNAMRADDVIAFYQHHMRRPGCFEHYQELASAVLNTTAVMRPLGRACLITAQIPPAAGVAPIVAAS